MLINLQNNANEGAPFVPQNITTEDDVVTWLQLTFPLFSTSDIAKVLLYVEVIDKASTCLHQLIQPHRYYPTGNETGNPQDPQFATDGLTTAVNANNVSAVASGQQQRVSNIYAETTFVCPAYWMAQAYSDPNKQAWKYQYSVVPALHGQDVSGFFGPASEVQGADFVMAFMSMSAVFQDEKSIIIELTLPQ